MDEEQIKETVEDVEDLVEDAPLDIAEDLGLVSEKRADKILAKVSQYKKQILIAIPTILVIVALVQSQL